MSSETDALLPRNPTAPEISGYGFSKSSEIHVDDDDDNRHGANDERGSRTSEGGPSPLRTIVGLFTTVIVFGLIISFFVPGGFSHIWHDTFKKPPQTIHDRVNQILLENPLIGSTPLSIETLWGGNKHLLRSMSRRP